MLRTEAVEAGTLDLIKKLMSDDKFKNFNLVGGTALALKIGHRESIDIDLFSTTSFDSNVLANHLTEAYAATRIAKNVNSIFSFVDDIKIDLIAHQYPLVEEIELIEGIRMVSLLDIGAMKLNAIFNSGKRYKDFVDLYYLLHSYSLNELLASCQKKYADVDIQLIKNSTVYHDEIIFVPLEYIGGDISWSAIKERLFEAFQNPDKKFGLPDSIKRIMEQRETKRKGKRNRL